MITPTENIELNQICDMLSSGTDKIITFCLRDGNTGIAVEPLREFVNNIREVRNLYTVFDQFYNTSGAVDNYIDTVSKICDVFENNPSMGNEEIRTNCATLSDVTYSLIKATAERNKLASGIIKSSEARAFKNIIEIMERMNLKTILDYDMVIANTSLPYRFLGDEMDYYEKICIDGYDISSIKLYGEYSNIYRNIYSNYQIPEGTRYDIAMILGIYNGSNFDTVNDVIQKLSIYSRYLIIDVLDVLWPVEDSFIEMLEQTYKCIRIKTKETHLIMIDLEPKEYEGRAAVYLVTHKMFYPTKNPMYIPIEAGAAIHEKLGFLTDDTGDNISELNPFVNELTALYWMWKNDNHEFVGLNHYRRFFLWNAVKNYDPRSMLEEEQLIEMMKDKDVLTSRPMSFYPLTSGQELSELFNFSELIERTKELSREVIEQYQPEYVDCYDEVMDGHMFIPCNLFIMRHEVLDDYCKWLFSIILPEVKLWREEFPSENVKDSRAVGFIAERLLSVWLLKQDLRVGHVKWGVNSEYYCDKKD